ncbi:secreted RxLR effector protein 161-like [Pyrus communis]|uniref:secreted RxLR effector protein 161-like n=1 Tax=Pyrus communis TaxID=23211 RepID=UPI0035C0B60C
MEKKSPILPRSGDRALFGWNPSTSSNYTQKVLHRFNEDKAKPSSIPMVVRTLNGKRDLFHPKEDEEEILEPKVPYLSAIGALLYLAQCIRPDISFAGTTDLGLFYTHESSRGPAAPLDSWVDSRPVDYADAGYLFDPHRAPSQTGYVFTIGDTAISWRSTKQTLVETSSNHAEILALREASRE